MVDGEETLCTSMSALAILSCRPNSHPFQERHISLHESIKIGRSVARARPSANNGIFDCKVLSRHHAMLWYEAGKFYLQDTKSSNGTFINNQRLCKGGEESPPKEVYSGDLIQFGVEVMENNRRGEKITHGCIIATISLYHPDGREAKPISYLGGENLPGISLQTQELYQLAQYLQEALHREKMLEQKLLTLQQLVHNTQEASESGWQALIDEDKLLSRLEMLENQLHVYSKNHSEDTLRQELVALQEDKDKYETTSKESLRRVLQEKLEAVTKLSDLEQSLSNMKEECTQLKTVCEVSQEELNQLALKYQDQLKEVSQLQNKLQEAEHSHAIELDRIEEEKALISTKLEEMTQQEISLSTKIESLQADNDFTKEQLAAMKAKLESLKELNEDELKLSDINLNGSTTEEVEIIPLGPPKEDDKPENLEAKLKDLQQLIETYKEKLEKSDQQLKDSNNKVEKVQKELDTALSSSNEYLMRIGSLEEKIKLSDFHMNQMVENALENLKSQLEESAKQSHSSNDLIEVFKDHIQLAEKELTFQTPINSIQNSSELIISDDSSDISSDLDSTKVSVDSPPASPPPLNSVAVTANSSHSTSSSPPLSSHINATFVGSPPPDLVNDTVVSGIVNTSCCYDAHSSSLSDSGIVTLSSSSISSHTSSGLNGILPSLDDDEGLKEEKDLTDSKLKESSDEVTSLKAKLSEAEQEIKEKTAIIISLQEQLKKGEDITQEVKQEILHLREQLEDERSKTKASEHELEEAKKQLTTAQQNTKQNHNETENLRDKLRHLQDELDSERNRRDSPRLNNSDRLAPKSKEYQALKEECTNLRKRIQAIEAEMKMSRKENLHLSSEYNKLQESYKHLESLKVKLENSELSWKLNLTDAQKDANNIRQEPSNSASAETVQSSSSMQEKLDEANREMETMKKSCEVKVTEIDTLQRQLTDLTSDYHNLHNSARMVSLVSSIPLLMLLFAILMAVYPVLESVTSAFS